MRNLRLTPLRKGQSVLGQEEIDPNTSLPTSTEDRKPLRLRPPSAPASSMPVLASPEIDSGFDVDYSELDRPINPMRNIEDQLADTQSGFQMTMNALGRAGAEIGLGTLEGISYLADFEQHMNILKGEEEEYSNWFADFMKKGKEAVGEAAPIYRTEEAQGGFAPFDSTWWASNAESIASTLSLMVPAAGAVRGLSMIGKAARAGLKGIQIATRAKNTSSIIKTANNLMYGKNASNIMKGAGQAVISRYMENTMEASEVFKNSYEQLLAKGVPEEEARARAGKGASQSWNTNWVNLGFDMMQYITLTKGLNVANIASKEFRKKAMGKAKDYLANMGQEAAEEGIQFVTGAEAERSAVEGKSYFELKGLGTRMADYLSDPEMKSAMFLGAVGGGVFEAAGGAINKIAGVDKTVDAYLATIKSLDNGDVKTAHMVQGTRLAQQAFAYAQAGRLGDLKNHYEEMAAATDEELIEKGMSTEEIADKRKRDAEILSDIEYIGETYSTIFNDTSKTPEQQADELGLLFETRVQERTGEQLQNSYTDLRNVALKTMSENQFDFKQNLGTLLRLKQYKSQVEKNLKGKPGAASLIEQLDNKIKQTEEALQKNKEQLKEDGNTEAIPISPVDSKLFGDPNNPNEPGIIPQMDQLFVNKLQVQRILSTANTPEGQKERQESVDNQKTENALKQVDHNAPYSVLQNVLNDNTLPDSAKKAVADQISKMEEGGEGTFHVPAENNEEEGMKLRYKSSVMLGKDIKALRDKGVNVAGITTGNAFINRYLKDSDFRKAANEHFSNIRKKTDGAQDPSTTTPQPSNNQPDKNNPSVGGNGSSPSFTNNTTNTGVPNEGEIGYAQTNEFAMTEFNDGFVRIAGVQGIKEKQKFSLEEALKILNKTLLGLEDAGAENAIKHIPEGGLWVLKDAEGQPVRSTKNNLTVNGKTVSDFMSDEDFRILNDPSTNLVGKKLKMTLLLDHDYNPSIGGWNQMLVAISTEIDGKEVRLGMLRSSLKGDTNNLAQLRKNIYEQWVASGNTSGTFELESEVKIKGRKTGSLNTVEQLNDPHTIVYEDEAVYFGIVTVEDGKVVILDNKGYERSEENAPFINKTYNEDSGLKGHPGQAVQFIRTSSGQYIPTYLFAQPLKDNTEVMQEVRDKVEAFYEAVRVKDGKYESRETIKNEFEKLEKELDARVSGRVVYDEQNDTLTVKEVKNAEGEIVDSVGLDVDGVMNILSERVMRLDLNEINKGDYNQKVSREGRVKSNISPSQHTFNSNVEMNFDDITVTPITEAAPTTTTQQTSGLVPNTNVIGLESDYSGDQFNVYVYTEDGNGKPIDLGFTLPSELTGKETWKVTVSVNTGRTDGKNPFLHNKAFDKTFNSREEAEKYAQLFIKQDKSKVDTTTAPVTETQKLVEKRKEQLEDAESQLNPNTKHPLFNVGQKYNENSNLIVEFDDQRTDKTKEGVGVISRVRKPATVDSNGKMVSAAEVEVTWFDSLEQAKESIASRYEKVKASREKRLAEAEAQLADVTTTIPTTKDRKPILQARTDKKGRTIEVEAVLSQDGSIVTTKYEAYRTDEKGRRKLSGSGYVTTVGELRSKLLESDSVDALEGLDDSAEVIIREESTTVEGSSSVTFIVKGAKENITTLTNDLIVKPFDTTTAPTTQAQPTLTVEVDQFEITYNPQTGEMTFANSNPVENPTVKNKVLVTYELNQATLRRAAYNGTPYAVLSDNRIISLSKTSAGKEVYKTGPQRNKILEQAGEPVVTEPTVTEPTVTQPVEDKPSSDPFDDIANDINLDDLGDDRTRAVDSTVEYEVWDEKEELAWFKKNYPDVPVEVLDDIKEVIGEGGPDAWGLFRNASVFIQSNAAKGTAYHEAFHAVFNLMLTEKERKAILEAGEDFATGAIPIEEYWSDKFMDYQLAEGATAHTLPEKVADFFKRLWHLIRIAGERVGIGSASMNDYMYRISKGLYANKVIGKIGNVNFKRNVTRFKVANTAENGMLNNSEKVFAKRVINGLVIEKVLPYYRKNILNDTTLDDRETLRKIVSDKSGNPVRSLQGVYTVAYKLMNNHLVDLVNDGTEKNKSAISQLSRTLETLVVTDDQNLPKVKQNGEFIFRPFLANVVTSLANYGVRYNVFTEDVNATTFGETSDILEETEDVIENWMVKEKFMGPFEKFSQKAAKLFSTIPSGDVFGGLKVFENPSNVKSTLIYEITDSSSDKEMMEKLRKLTLFKPQYDKMYTALQNDKALQAEFYAYLGQLKNTGFMVMYAKEDGTGSFTATNKRNLKNDLVENFRYNMYNNSGYYNPEDNTFKDIPNIEEDVKELEDILKSVTKDYNSSAFTEGSSETYGLTEEQINKVYELAKKYKLDFSKERMKKVFAKNDTEVNLPLKRFMEFAGARQFEGKGFLTVLKKLKENKNPFFNEDLTGINSVNNMMDVMMMSDEQRYQPTPKNINGDTIYTALQSRFMFKLLNKFKTKKTLPNGVSQFNHETLKNYQEDPFYADSPFLNDLIEDNVMLENLDFMVFDGLRYQNRRQGKEYKDLTPQELESVNINAYFNSKPNGKEDTNYGYYMVPVLADSTSAAFIKSKKYSKEEAMKRLIATAKQERARINFIKKLKEEGKTEFITDSMDANGESFQLFTFLNNKNYNDDSVLEKLVRDNVEKLIDSEYEKLITSGVIKERMNLVTNVLEVTAGDNNSAIDKGILKGKDGKFNIQKYIINNMYMNAQTAITFAGDTAFYKNKKGTSEVDFTDFYKRVKEIWSPGTYIATNPENTFTDSDGNAIGVRSTYNVSYQEDPTELKAIKSAHRERIAELFPDDKDSWIRKAYDKLNNTDAATWIDIYRLREINIGLGEWDNKKQEIFDKVMKGEKLPTDAGLVFNPIKPFNFSHKVVNTGIGKMIMPTQHKNAEMLLTPDMAIGNPKIEEMMEKMGYIFDKNDKGDIISWAFDIAKRKTDAIMFASAVKVGRHKVQKSIADITSDNVISMRNEDYRVQQKTPEHHIDSENLFGSQFRKIIMNIDPTDTFIDPVSGKEILGEEAITNYQRAIELNIKESYDELIKKFQNEDGSVNKEGLVNAMREQAIEMEYGEEIVEAFDWLDENKNETVLPMWHPHISARVEAMMYSYFKNAVTKQKVKGLSVFNTTSYGFEENNNLGLRKPEIKFDDRETIKINGKEVKNPNYRGIKYYEALLPAHLKGLEQYANEEGIIDINKVPDDIKKGIFYRIPTEDAYSIFHIKVIGYLPSAVGGQVILPDEATTIAGLDFDIDKLYGMTYNLEEYKEPIPNKEAEYQNFIKTSNYSPQAGQDIVRADIDNFDDERGRMEFANKENIYWDKDDNQFTKKPILRKIPSGFETKEARDNMIIDMSYAVLQNSETTKSQLKPGNFETLKAMKKNLDLIRGESDSSLNPLLPSTRSEVFERNMTGAQLIGVFANHNANHLLMIHGDFQFTKGKDFDNAIKINGKSARMLNNRVFAGIRISDSLAEFLAAVVDNAKEPLSSFLNVNSTTADWIATMLRVGHDIPTSIALMNTAPVKMMINDLKLSGRTGKTAIANAYDMVYDAHKEALKQIVKNENPIALQEASVEEKGTVLNDIVDARIAAFYREGPSKLITFKIKNNNPQSIEDFEGSMLDSIKSSADMDTISNLTEEQILNRIGQLKVVSRVMKNSDALSTTQAAMRYDSANNAAGPDVMSSLDLEEKFDAAVLADNPDKTIIGFTDFITSKKVPYVYDIFKYGVKAANRVVKEVTGIPYADRTGVFARFIFEMNATNASVKEKNLINRMFMSMIGSGYVTYDRNDIVRVMKDLPDKISEYVEKNPDSKYRLFLSRFAPTSSIKTDGYIFFNFNRSGVDKIHQQELSDMWKSMLDSDNEIEREIANDLLKYAFGQTGYTFGPNAFMDIVPTRHMSEMHEDPNISYTDYIKQEIENLENKYDKLKKELANAKDEGEKFSIQLKIKKLFAGLRNQAVRNLYSRLDSVPRYYPSIKGVSSPMSMVNNIREINVNAYTDYIKVVIKPNEETNTQGNTFLMKAAIDQDGNYEMDQQGRRKYRETQPLGINNNFLEIDYHNAMTSSGDSYVEIISAVNELKNVNVQPMTSSTAAPTLNVVEALPDLMAGASEDLMMSLKNFNPTGKIDLSHPFVAFYKKMSAEEKGIFKQGLIIETDNFGFNIEPANIVMAKQIMKELVDAVDLQIPTTLPEVKPEVTTTQPTPVTKSEQLEMNFGDTPTAVTTEPAVNATSEKVANGVTIVNNALTKSEEKEIFDMLKPIIEAQGGQTNKGTNAPIMIGLGVRWDYKSNNPGREIVDISETIDNSTPQRNKYAYYNVSINGEPLKAIPNRLKELMTKATGVDTSDYDGAIINLYRQGSFVSAHNDVDESKQAIKYPVLVTNIGGEGSLSIEGAESQQQGRSYAQKEYVNHPLKSGDAYVFGENGVNRKVFHRTLSSSGRGDLPALNVRGINVPENSYRISITLRRVKDLETGMPTVPAATSIKTEPTAPIVSNEAVDKLIMKQLNMTDPLKFQETIATWEPEDLEMVRNQFRNCK